MDHRRDQQPAAVDEDQPLVGVERGDVRERRKERSPVGDRDERPGVSDRMVGLDRLPPVPEGVREPEQLVSRYGYLSPTACEGGSLSKNEWHYASTKSA